MQSIVRKAVRPFMVVLKGIILSLIICAACGALAVTKPLAVWNGDFPTSGTDTRGGITLSLNGNTSDGKKITISSSATGGVTLMNSSANLSLVAAVAGIKTNNVDITKSPVLITARNSGNDNTVGLQIGSTGTLSPFHSTSTSFSGGATSYTWPSGDDTAYFAFKYNQVSSYGDRGTYGYYVTPTSSTYVYGTASLVNGTTATLYGLTIGGLYSTSATTGKPTLANAEVNYVAMFTSSGVGVDDFKVWSLPSGTSANTLTSGDPLSSSDNATLASQGINLPINGYITISGDVTVAAVFAQGNSEIRFADENSSLTVSGPVYVADSNTLTITPAVLTTTDTAKTLISASVIGSASNVSVTVPTESGYSYVSSVGDTAITLTRYKDIGLDYTAAPGGGFYPASTWFTAFASNSYNTPDAYRVGPSAAYPAVYEVYASKFNPYVNYTATLPFSFAIYADLSEMAENTVIMAFGTAANGIIMYKNSDNGGIVRVGRVSGSQVQSGYAEVARPNSGKGYHLYTVTCAADGTLKIYVDDGSANGSGSISTDALGAGFQIGSIYGGWGTSGNRYISSWMSAGNKMAVAKVLGWNNVLSAADIAALAAEYSATTGTIDRDISWNNSGKTLRVYSSEPAEDVEPILGVDAGTVEIPAGEEVTVTKVHADASNASADAAAITVAGTLNVTASNASVGQADMGVTLGYWMGLDSGNRTSSLTVAEGGVLNAPSAYLQMPWSTKCQGATVNVNGTAKIKAVYRNSSGGAGTLTLANGGTLEVAEILSSGGDITKNFGYGTFKVDADASETRAINFNASSADSPTTLDPNGHTLTMAAAAMTGSGAVTVGGSNGGTVVFSGWTSSFMGTLVYTAENSSMISVSSWDNFTGTISGEITITDDNASLFADFPWGSFTGTLNYAVTGGTLDLSTYTMTYATINVTGTGAKVILKENSFYKFNVSTGASAEVLVSADTYHYAGYVPSGTIAGTVTYKYTDDDGATYSAVASDAYNGSNLLPYWQIFTGHADGDVLTGTLSTASDWNGGEVKTSRNVAFNVTDGKTLTVTVDTANSYSFGEIQVYGDGKVVFVGEGAMSVSTALYVTDGTDVEVQAGVSFAAMGGISIVGGSTATLNGSGITVPFVMGDGEVVVAEDSTAVITYATLATLTVNGTLNLATGCNITPSVLEVSSTGIVNAPANGTINPTSASGAGRVVFTGRLPTSTAWATGTATTGWRGTIAVSSWNSSGSNQWTPANYGNAYSTLEVDGCNVYYFDGSGTTTTLPTLKLVGDLTINNGGSSSVNVFAGLSGTGTLKCGTGNVTQTLKFGTVEDFAGSINNVSFKVVVGTGGGDGKTITIESGYVFNLASGKSLKSDSIKLNGTLNVAGTGILEGAVTAANSAKIVLNDSPLTISGTLTATALEVDPGAIALSTTPTAIITGLTAAPTITGLTVENCDITTSEVDGKYVVYAAYKDTAWSGESGDWTESSFNGGTLATDGEDISFVAGANGAVAVTLTGTRAPANVVFNGGSTSTYTLTGGTFSPSGTVTVENGSVTIESAATGTYVVKDGATLSLTNATVTSVSGAGTLNIPAGGVVTLASATALDSLAYITGEGELHVGANIPATTLNTLLKKSYTENDATAYYWRGTVVIEDFVQTNDSTVGGTTLDCGNASSIIQLKNCTIRYFNQFTTRADLEIVGTVKTLNGSGTTYTEFGKLKGTGSFIHENDVRQLYRFTSGTDFTGTIEVRGRRIVFGTDGTGNDTTDRDTYGNTIRISSGYTATLGAGSHWTAYNGVIVYGTMVVKGANSYIEHNDQASKGIVFNDGATIRFDSLSTLKFGNSTLRTPSVASGSTVNIAFGDGVVLGTEPGTEMQLISWGGAPEGDFEFADVTTPKCYRLEKRENGLYLVVKPGTIFSVY